MFISRGISCYNVLSTVFFCMQAAYNVIAYKHKPRLQTAVELLNTTQDLEKQLDKVSCVFIFCLS